MATNTVFYYYFFISLLCTSTVLSRTLDQKPKICFLDLSASAQRMLEVPSFEPEKQQEEVGEKSDSPFTLKLFSRDTILKTPFKNYEELIVSRLERDSARLNYLSKKLTVVKNEDNDLDFDQTEIEAPLTSGLQQGSAQYFARFGVGTPARQFYLAIDTGSDINWIQCAPCTQCYHQVDPLFEPSGSSSYTPLSCNSPSCGALEDGSCSTANTCSYRVSYGDGSSTQGDYATETLTFGNSAVDNVAIGCGRINTGLFVGYAGLLGLGRGALSLPSQIRMPSFSYCLVHLGSASASTLDFSSITIPSNAITTPLLRNSRIPIFYYVGLTGISVGGQLVPISASEFSINPNGGGGVIVDSGTTITRFPASVYNVFRDAFVSGVTELPPGGSFSIFDTCFNTSSRTAVTIPTVAFHFGSQSLTLPPNNYMLLAHKDLLCFAFAATGLPTSIIGNFQQQGIRVIFDVGRSLVGFALNQC